MFDDECRLGRCSAYNLFLHLPNLCNIDDTVQKLLIQSAFFLLAATLLCFKILVPLYIGAQSVCVYFDAIAWRGQAGGTRYPIGKKSHTKADHRSPVTIHIGWHPFVKSCFLSIRFDLRYLNIHHRESSDAVAVPPYRYLYLYLMYRT